MREQLRDYYYLTKPGIIYGNVLTTVAGFLFASQWHFGWGRLLATIFGTSLVIASACVWNNYLDRDIDTKMDRTQGRALAARRIPVTNALSYGVILGLLGIFLVSRVNSALLITALVGFVDYVIFYGWTKRHTPWGTLVGSISGSMPLVGGYVAVIDHFNATAGLLFLVMVAWQMAHFYGIALYRRKDYQRAGIPVLSVVSGPEITHQRTVGWLVAYLTANILLGLQPGVSLTYLFIMPIVAAYWMWRAVLLWGQKPDIWGRKIFLTSLFVLLIFSVLLMLNPWLP